MPATAPLFILYGSATGNAEHIAKSLSESIPPSSLPFYDSVQCLELNSFKRKCFPIWATPRPNENEKHPVIIVTSTTGNADPPENAGRFYRMIKRRDEVAKQPFKNVTFGVLGLGDTNYDQFCGVAKLIDKKMKDLGGVRAKDIGMADEATGLEDVVEPWIETVMDDIRSGCLGNWKNKNVPAAALEGKMKDLSVKETVKEITPVPVVEKEVLEEKKQELCAGLETIGRLSSYLSLLPLPTSVPAKALPSISKSMSSCQFLDPSTSNQDLLDRANSVPDDGMTMSSYSSTTQQSIYTHTNPFPSPIHAARYLTHTDASHPCKSAVTAPSPLEAARAFEHHFSESPKNQKRVLELTLGLPDDFTIEYQPGDSIGLIVSNKYTKALQTVLTRLERSGSDVDKEHLCVNNSTEAQSIRQSLEECVELTATVKKHTLAGLESHTKDPAEAFALRLLASKTPAGQALYDAYVVKQQIDFGDLLQDFPSCQPPIDAILGLLPGIAPRYYSIVSSPLEDQGKLKIAFSVVDYFLDKSNQRKAGLATRYLETVCSSLLLGKSSQGEKPTIQIFPKPTTEFLLPSSPSVPLILIGPGTGIAPFLGFISHRRGQEAFKARQENMANEGTWRGGTEIEEVTKEPSDANTTRGSIDVFFGCRHKDHDYLYEKELAELQNTGYVSKLHLALSRTDGVTKTYVQDKMKEDGARLMDLVLNKDASVYVCGDGTTMAKDVQDCMVALLEKEGKVEGGKAFLEAMKRKRKFVMDIWGN